VGRHHEQASHFRFWRIHNPPGFAVLQFDTDTNPIRVFLSKEQLDELIGQAKLTSEKLRQDLPIAYTLSLRCRRFFPISLLVSLWNMS
jgi:hypothetical protein